MNKLVLSALTLLTCSGIYALPVGNPSEASLFTNGIWWDSNGCNPCCCWCDALSLRIGFYGDYVFNRHMRGNKEIKDTEIFTNAGYLALNICDRVDVFTTLGATHLFVRTNVSSFSNASFIGDFEFSTDFSWSLGTRATLWERNCFAVGLEGQYFRTTNRLDHFINGSDGTLTYFDEDNNFHYHEWQAGLGVSYRFITYASTIAMVPYLAVKWSQSELMLNHFTFTDDVATYTLHKFRSKKHWGLALGMSLTLCNMIGVTVEGRWADEKAVSVNGQFRF